MFKSFKKKIEKKIDEEEKSGKSKDKKQEFEEVDMKE